MRKYNGKDLKRIIDIADSRNIKYEIVVKSVHGLYGVYVEFEKEIKDGGYSYFNIALIEEIKDKDVEK